MKTDYLDHLSSSTSVRAEFLLDTPFGDPKVAQSDPRAVSSTTRAQGSTKRYLPFGSLWDPHLLDRLTEPLTRYHE